MAIFLDTGEIEEIERYHRMGMIRGVTTNPTILAKCGVKGGTEGIRLRSIDIAKLIAPLPLSVEVISNEPEVMLQQAREFSGWADNINIKIPIHGPNGELYYLELAHHLEKTLNIRVNVTAMMSAQQCFLAALSGATYVSLFGGRVNNMGYNCVGEIRKLRTLLDNFGLKSRIIVGSTREVLNVVEWLVAGAHIVTVTPNLLASMLIHPYSKETVEMFLKDAMA